MAKGVAGALDLTYLDSGAMYRCVALAALRAGADLDDGEALGHLSAGVEIELGGALYCLTGRTSLPQFALQRSIWLRRRSQSTPRCGARW